MHRNLPLTSITRRIFCRYAILPLVLLAGCARDSGKDQQQTIPPEIARIVDETTSGTIASRDAIYVRFVEPAIDSALIGHPIETQAFTFAPQINGICRWESTRDLVFRPDRPLPLRQSYQAQLNLSDLRNAFAQMKPLQFRFDVAGREIRSLEGDFELQFAYDPRYLTYRGRLELTEKVDVERVREAISFLIGETRLPLAWQADATDRVFNFTSPVIEREKIQKSFKLLVDNRILELSRPYEWDISLAPLQDMALVDVKRDETGERPRLILIFSDEIDVRHPIEGLVQIRPKIPIRLKASGKQLYVDGSFSHGESCSLDVFPGIQSRWGTRTEEVVRRTVHFADRKPQIRFARDGVFLPSSKDKRIRFATLNLSWVYVEVKQVFASNLGQFLQTERLDSSKERRDSFSDYNVRRVGLRIALDVLEISSQRNIWLEHELDLGSLIAGDVRGLFLIELSFDNEGMLYRPSPDGDSNEYSFRSNPEFRSYIDANGRAYKALIISDIGLTYKRGHGQHLVYATHLEDASPLTGARVNLRTYQNQIAASLTTDAQGLAQFKDVGEEIFYIEAEHRGQRSLIRPDKMAWNMSTFDVGGVNAIPSGIRAFIYTERGVYRPGDEINLSVIARHQDGTFPADHPATCRIFNPGDQLVVEHVQLKSREGMYTFAFTTRPEDPTGNWRARIRIGDSTFDHTLKIETVVPFRVKTRIRPAKARLGREDEFLIADLHSAYLVGSPASGLETELTVSLNSARKTFPKYPGFSFNNALIDYQPLKSVIFKDRLDAEGRAHVEWPLPPLGEVPSTLKAVITAKVLDKGGRPNLHRHVLPIDPYDHYVGLKQPEFEYGDARVGAPVRIPVIVTDSNGNPVKGRDLRYRVYQGTSYWWWEYEDHEAFRRRFKTDRRTELISEQRVVSALNPIDLLFKPSDQGEFLIEVADGDDGHVAACFVNAHPFGSTPSGAGHEGMLSLKTNRARYRVGDVAMIRFPVPKKGSVLFSLEKVNRVLNSQWHFLDGAREEADISFTVTDEMIPTAYATVSLIQPHGHSGNDRPMRLFGTVPIAVHDPASRIEFDIDMPGQLRPGKPFAVTVQSSIADSVEFTIAIVDQGLLALTDFRTPDPWQYFFQKQRLDVRTSDLFAHVIGVSKGDPFKTFSIGGGVTEEQPAPVPKRRRFPAVSMFSGPLSTDASGWARVEFTMPNYVGAVRAMVVGVRDKSFGHAEKTAEVKNDLMVVSTLPRAIGPGDRIHVPVTVFAMAETIARVEVSIKVHGPLAIVGEARQWVDFADAKEQDVYFRLKADDAVGPATIVVEAHTAKSRAFQQTELDVRPSSAPNYESDERAIAPGETVSFIVPDRGLPGTNRARISVRRRPDFNFDNQMLRLVRYPYGCLEQTISAVFPQLYLKDLLDLEPDKRSVVAGDIDERINAAVVRLRRFQLSDGSFSLWPGQRRTSVWGSLYAGHFLIEARSMGYYIPGDIFNGWLKYQESRSASTRDPLRARTYRVYMLALAGKPAHSAMNLLRENDLPNMNNTDRWLLATAYLVAGNANAASEIARGADFAVAEYRETAGTYGSDLRDRALILDNLVAFERWGMADSLAKIIVRGVRTGWHSTQTSGVSLLALGKYVLAQQKGNREPAPLTGRILLPDGRSVPFNVEGLGFQREIANGFGGNVEVHLDPSNSVARAFVSLDWEGVPLWDSTEDEEDRISLDIEWLDEDGDRVDPANLSPGTTFWGHIRVENGVQEHSLEEVALTQLFPAGWEIENTRLSNEALPKWTDSWRLNAEEYLDIRDDRVNWFLDLPRKGRPLDFVVKLNAVTQGTFTLPPTRVEAMYNRDFRARKGGGIVVVGR